MGRKATGIGSSVRNNIRALRLKAGMTATELCRRAGMSTSQLSRLELQRRRFSLDIADRLAAALGVTRAAITEDIDMDAVVVRVTVTGQVQEQVWSDRSDLPPEDRYEMVIRTPEKYSTVARRASEVLGLSMNKVFPEGTILAWVPFDEIEEPLLPGRRYLISRMREDGMCEFTVKTHMRDHDGRDWFYPESTDSRHQAPVALDDPMVKAAVLGRVTDAIIPQL